MDLLLISVKEKNEEVYKRIFTFRDNTGKLYIAQLEIDQLTGKDRERWDRLAMVFSDALRTHKDIHIVNPTVIPGTVSIDHTQPFNVAIKDRVFAQPTERAGRSRDPYKD